jgi:glycosyltransferase involved in cell wall biosynthesis
MKIALVHDWLTGMRGGEKCLEAFCELYPDADLFTLVHVPGSVSPKIEDRRITTSALQRIPGIGKRYRFALPLMPMAIESLDLSSYDLVISTSHCVAKGVLIRPEATHVSYVHTPMRYAWDLWPQYFPRGRRIHRLMLAPLLHYLRTWDVIASSRVSHFVANSNFVRRRILRYYGRNAVVVHPPVDTAYFDVEERPGDYYLMVAAMVPYKGIDLAVRAFNELDKPLKIVGDGHLRQQLMSHAGPTIEFLGRVSDAALRDCYASCKALVLPCAEDFGIAPVEAQAAGKPIIALGRAGALDTVVPLNPHPSLMSGTAGRSERVPPPTGVFFFEYSADALAAAVRFFEENADAFRPDAIREHAKRFDKAVFKQRMKSLIRSAVHDDNIEQWEGGDTVVRTSHSA